MYTWLNNVSEYKHRRSVARSTVINLSRTGHLMHCGVTPHGKIHEINQHIEVAHFEAMWLSLRIPHCTISVADPGWGGGGQG